MPPETLMLYKLIVLYILDRVDFPMTNTQVVSIITEREYANYFTVQQVLAELVDDGYISLEQKRNAAFYRITPDGHEALSFFYKNISRNIRDDIDMYLSEQQYALREESSNVADYYEARKGEYSVELKVLERDATVIEIHLTVPSRENAETICRNWRKNNADVYAYILNSLLGDNEEAAPTEQTQPDEYKPI
jgi:DNA-binding PadR family transcriptional regulator